MKNIVLPILLFLATLGCTKKKDMSIYLDQNLNDFAHIGNLEIKKQKGEILEKILLFDKYYEENLWEIRYVFSEKFWWVGWESDVDDAFRISYLRDSILPKITNCEYLTPKLKDKAQKNAKLDDPGNAGYILTQSEYGKNIQRISIQKNKYSIFHNRCYLYEDRDWGDDPDAPLPREIGEEEGWFYLLSFVKIIDETHAVYKINVEVANFIEQFQIGFLIIELEKEQGKWLIDDMYYVEKEDLIPVKESYNLIDYTSNKEAYDTGVPKP